jgi:hypothetical protein
MATICEKCGLFISRRKVEKSLLRREWCEHREDVPKNLRTFTQFLKWGNTIPGRKWVKNQQKDRTIELSNEDASLFLGETPSS